MSEVNGSLYRFAINMGTTGSKVWKQLQNETTVDINTTAEFEDISSKDTGNRKKKAKGLLDANLSLECVDDLAPATNFLSYKDIIAIADMTQDTAGGTTGTGTGGGNFEMKLVSTTTGATVEEFTGFITDVSKPNAHFKKIRYTFKVEVNSVITRSQVV